MGDVGPAGGLIFFVDEDNQYPEWTYLEAAPANWNQESGDPQFAFTDGSIAEFPVTSNLIGTGKENTAAILGHTVGSQAAAFVNNQTVNGFSDWAIPSNFELQTMYTNLLVIGDGDLRGVPASSHFIAGRTSAETLKLELLWCRLFLVYAAFLFAN